MKEFVIIIIILTIIFGGALYTQKYLNNTSDTLVSKLEDLKTDLERVLIWVEHYILKII